MESINCSPDTHGFTEVNFALTGLLDLEVAPRIHRLPDQPFQALPRMKVLDLRFCYKFRRLCWLDALPVRKLCDTQKKSIRENCRDGFLGYGSTPLIQKFVKKGHQPVAITIVYDGSYRTTPD